MNNTITSLKTLLTDWALIHVDGPDAGPFLQNLLTNNVLNMDVNSSKFAGFCSPKGRLLASFWVTHFTNDSYDLWVSKDIAEEFSKKLNVFRFRSKVEITCHSDDQHVIGELSQTPFSALDTLSCNLPTVTYQNTLYYRRLIFSQENAELQQDSFWTLLEVLSGIPRITLNTKDLFVPQMLNFDLIGAVDFKKGCYPGQEIVARSQYLGTIKRRLKLGSFEPNSSGLIISPGTEVFMQSDQDQPCGVVVLSSFDKQQNKYYLQLELNNSASQSPIIFSPQYLKLEGSILVQDPPYSIMVA